MDLFYSYASYFPYLGDWALAALRAVLGIIFIAHGFPKAMSFRQTIQGFGGMGFKPGWFWGPFVTVVELGGGLLLLLGFWTPLAAFFLMGEFAVINFWKIFRREPLVGGFELDLLILAGLFTLFAFGPGSFSLEYLL